MEWLSRHRVAWLLVASCILDCARSPACVLKRLDHRRARCSPASPRHEAHVPTAQHPSGTHARLSRPNVNAWRSESLAESPPQGTCAPRADDLQEVVALQFGRDRRLRRHAEFAREQREGRRVGTPHFTLLVAAQPPPPRASRLGVVVARKIGSAVRRNRVKRLCRECFRTWPDLLPKGVDLIVIAREGAQELRLSQVRSEWSAVELRLKKRAAEALARVDDPDHPPASRL